MFWSIAALMGCAGNIHELYEQEKNAVLKPAPLPRTDSWEGDIHIRISPEALSEVSQAALDAGLLSWKKKLSLDTPIGTIASVRPRAHVTRLKVTTGGSCPDCLSLSGALEGEASWRAGPLSGSVPFTAKIGGDLVVSIERDGTDWAVMGTLAELSRLKVSAAQVGTVDVSRQLSQWGKAAVEAAPAFRISTLGGDVLPLRALRLTVDSAGLGLEALADVNGGTSIPTSNEALESDWQLRTSTETALAIMRRAAFEAGTLSHDVAIDPRALTAAASLFTLDLRIWRLSGPGWWRDYTVDGRMRVRGRKIELEGERAVEGDKSRGAGIADPLALLAEGRILEAVVDSLKQVVPGSRSAAVGDHKLKAVTREIKGIDGELVLTGVMKLEE
ncbi:MAG: hypothetical protein ACI8RZ_001182 [Myxococcota bacterium]|jgi:hypothetical protein